MNPVPPPCNFLDPQFTEILRRYAAAAEQSGDLDPRQLDLIYRENWFNLFVPQAFGGLERSLPEALRIEEGLAWADGSIGWTVTLCSGAAWFIGYLPGTATREIFADPRVCLAGSGMPAGLARRTAGGYEVSGCWPYASGANHATVFTANCRLEAEGKPVLDEMGRPQVIPFWFRREEVQVRRAWKAMGLIATASHSFEVACQVVPPGRAFSLEPRDRILDLPVFAFPFLQLAESTLSVNLSGMAWRFLELCVQQFGETGRGRAGDKGEGEQLLRQTRLAGDRLDAARQDFYESVDRAWQDVQSGQSVPSGRLREISRQSRRLAAVSRGAVDEIYPYCGMAAAMCDSELNRVWRNFHTASQHRLLLFPLAEP